MKALTQRTFATTGFRALLLATGLFAGWAAPLAHSQSTLRVSRDGAGAGTVVAWDGGIDCGPTCEASYPLGSEVTLSAAPWDGSHFVTWGGDCYGVTSPLCTLSMDRDQEVTAFFGLDTFSLLVVREGDGSGRITSDPAGIDCGSTCTASFDSLVATVTLTMAPDPGTTFVGWSGACAGASTSCVVDMSESRTVRALLSTSTSELVVRQLNTFGPVGGIVISDPPGIDCGSQCRASFASGMSVRLRAEPIQLMPLGPAELDFLWEGPCEETPERDCIVTMDAPRVHVNVYFYRVPEDATSETLTVNTTGAGTGRVISDPGGINCQIECSSSFRTGSVVTLTAVPDVDSVVVGWSASGSATFPSSSQIRFTMDGPREVTARFELREYPVTVTKTGEGAGRVLTEPAGIDCGADCEGGFPVGTTVTLRAEPDEDSRLVSLAVSGATEFVSPGVVRFTVQGAREVNARFEPIYRTVTVTKTGDGGGRVFTEPAGIDCGAVCEVTFRSGTTVTVTAEADADSRVASFSASGNGEFLAPNIVRFTVREDRQVSVRFDLTGRPVTVSRWGDGDGRVTSSPAGIDCGLACQSSFPLGTTVTLLATPAPYSAFGGWSASGAAEFPSPREIRFTVDAARTVSARFNRTANLLDVRKTGTGRGTVSSRPSGISCGDDCTEYFPIGATVTLSAARSPDSKFAGWGGACSGTGTCTVSMGSSRLVTADFVYAPYWLEVGKLGDGNGRVVSTPSGIDCGADCTENYAGGRLVALEATPAPGSEFVGWNLGTCPGTGSCVVIMNELRIRVSAIFRRVSYSLSVTKSGSGSGLVSSSPSGISCGSDCSEWYAIDSVVSLSATASSGSIFTGWGGACSGTGLCTVTMDASKNVTANFSPALTRLTVSKLGTGSGTVSSNPGGINCGSDCSQYYANGTRVTLNASASSGSYFVGWGGACSGTGTCTVTMDASKNVTAKFSPVQRRLLVSKSGAGSGTVTSNPGGIYCGSDCWQYYPNGTRVTLNASASSGSYFAGWSGACSGTGTCTVTMNGAKNVTASFLPFYRLLSVSKSGNGTGTVSSNPGGIYCGSDCWQYYASGTTVALNARPSSGSYFAGWTGACSGTGSCNVTMNGSKSVTATFKLLSYRLTVTKLGEGAGAGYVWSNPAGISCGSDCIQWYWNGTRVTLTAAGSRPYRFVGWGGACSGVTGPTCTVSMFGSKSVTAKFIYDP